MRVTKAFARIRRDESGAVAMIVAVCLVVLLGLLVLVFDLGRGVAYKRQVVSGTDAAALAAAQQCALGEGTPNAAAAAAAALDKNVDLPVEITGIEMPECDSPAGATLKSVTVTTSADIDYYFAPVFGVDSGNIVARAVAVWGPAAVANPVPISVDLEQLGNCGIVPNEVPDEEIDCVIEYPKDTLEEPRWGVLDLSQWNDPNAAAGGCSVSADDLSDMIQGTGWTGEQLYLNGDPPGSEPTYTCVDNGLSFSVWSGMEGRTLIFPVVDIATSTGHVIPPRSGGPACTGAMIPDLQAAGKDCQIDTVNVIGWVVLNVSQVDNVGSTITVSSVTDVTTEGIPGGAFDLGVRGVRIVE